MDKLIFLNRSIQFQKNTFQVVIEFFFDSIYFLIVNFLRCFFRIFNSEQDDKMKIIAFTINFVFFIEKFIVKKQNFLLLLLFLTSWRKLLLKYIHFSKVKLSLHDRRKKEIFLPLISF